MNWDTVLRTERERDIPAQDPIITSGASISVRTNSAENAGAWSLIDYTAPPHFSGPPLHWHAHTIEVFYVREGTMAFTLGEETFTARAGSFVVVSPGIVHTFWNPTAASVTCLIWYMPGGFEEFYAAMAGVASAHKDASVDTTAYVALMAAYDQFLADEDE